MTDKTSTAPVMSLQKVRDALHEAHNSPGFEAVLDSCVAAIDAHLNAPTSDVVGGDVVDGVRVPLHETWADIDALIARVEQNTLSRAEVVATIRGKIDAALTAAPRVQGDAVAVREALETCERWFTAHMAVAPLIGGHGHAEHPMLTTIRTALAAQPKVDVSHPAEQTRGDDLDRCSVCGKPPLPTDFASRPYRSVTQLLMHMTRVVEQGFTPPITTIIEWRDAVGKLTNHDTTRQAVPDGLAQDAARYRWWRDNIERVSKDWDGVRGVSYAMCLDICRDYSATQGQIADAVADAAIAAAPSAGRMGVDRG